MEEIAASSGYVIAHDDDDLVFAYRGTPAPLLVGLISGGIGFAAGVVGATLASAGQVGALWILGPLSVVALVIGALGLSRWRARVRAPLDRFITHRLGRGGLRDRGDVTIATAESIEVETPRNLSNSTHGSMRWVRLRWPENEIRVYTAASAEAERVAVLLRARLAQYAIE